MRDFLFVRERKFNPSGAREEYRDSEVFKKDKFGRVKKNS